MAYMVENRKHWKELRKLYIEGRLHLQYNGIVIRLKTHLSLMSGLMYNILQAYLWMVLSII